MLKKKVIYFIKVKPKFLKKWEVYTADYDMLKECYQEVLLTNNYLKFLLYLIKNPNSDIYTWWWNSSTPIIILGKLFRRRTFCTGAEHMTDFSSKDHFFQKSIIYKICTKLSLRLSSFNIFISKDQKLSISSQIYVNNPYLIYSSLTKKKSATYGDINDFGKYLKNDQFNFLFIGWLTKECIIRKSTLITLRALSNLIKNTNYKINFNICGLKGSGLEIIQDHIIKLNLQNEVKVNLNLNEAEKKFFYQSSDLLLTPSFMEGFGNASLEAMANGCPSLVSKYGASPEVVGDTGYIIFDINEKSIEEKLLEYMNLTLGERIEKRKKAYERSFLKFGLNQKVDEFKKLLN